MRRGRGQQVWLRVGGPRLRAGRGRQKAGGGEVVRGGVRLRVLALLPLALLLLLPFGDRREDRGLDEIGELLRGEMVGDGWWGVGSGRGQIGRAVCRLERRGRM